MKYLSFKNTKTLGALLLSAVLFTACEKEDDVKYESGRPTIIKLVEAGPEITIIARDVDPPVETFALISISRDATTPNDLKSTLNVKLAYNTDLIDAYNDAHGSSFIPVPTAAYTLSEDITNLTFAPGEFLKKITITLDKAQLDLSEQYAMGLSITEVGSGAKISVLKDVLFSIGVKNKYDGDYHLNLTTSGWDAFGIAENVPGDFPEVVGFVTAGASTLTLANYYGGSNLQPAFTTANASATQFGAAAPRFTFDPVTDKLTSVTNSIPDDGRGRTFFLNPAATAADNYYDPATKTIYANYILTQNGRPNLIIKSIYTYAGVR